MNVIRKALASITPIVDDVDDPNGSFELVLSDPTLDREKEIVDAKCFGALPDHITMDIDHGMSVSTTVGSGTPSYAADGSLVVKGTYASTELGQMTRTLVNEGHIRSASVAFMPVETEMVKGVKHVRKAVLLNGAFTGIPVNESARILTSKSVREVKAGARNSAADMERIQTMHDTSVELGADCSGAAKSIRSVKAIVGTVEALQERVRDALEDAYGDYATCLHGVDPDKGLVYFDWWAGDGDHYQQAFTDDGAVVTLEGDATEVDIQEVVVPDADADREADEPGPTMLSVSPADAAGKSAAPVAADKPTADASDDDIAMRALLLSIDAHAATA